MPIGFFAFLAIIYAITQVPPVLAIAIGVLVLAIGVCSALMAAQDRRRRRDEYNRMLAEFRWRDGITPLEFELHCADYLRLKGWTASTTKGSGDQGVDVLATKAGVRMVLQCKLYSKAVGNKAVQEAFAARTFAGAQHAAVVTNATYTPAARELAAKTGVHLLHFTDLARADMLFGIRVANTASPTYVVPAPLPQGRAPATRRSRVVKTGDAFVLLALVWISVRGEQPDAVASQPLAASGPGRKFVEASVANAAAAGPGARGSIEGAVAPPGSPVPAAPAATLNAGAQFEKYLDDMRTMYGAKGVEKKPSEAAPALLVVPRIAANVRASPSDAAAVLRVAPAGSELRVHGRQGGWVQVGDVAPWGWIHSSLLRPSSN